MSTYEATISWTRGDDVFTDGKYSRRHLMSFDGGAKVPGSSSPHSVRVPFSDPTAVDPEESFVASLSSCHMLWFLAIAARNGFLVNSYEDRATGELGPGANGRLAMLRVTLHPATEFGGDKPSNEQVDAMHDEAHHECFIANSVRTEVLCKPVYEASSES